jgi:hypothetical protein
MFPAAFMQVTADLDTGDSQYTCESRFVDFWNTFSLHYRDMLSLEPGIFRDRQSNLFGILRNTLGNDLAPPLRVIDRA